MHPASRDAVVVWREAEGSHSADYSDSESRGGGSGIITDLPESKFKRGAGCVGLIAILILPFLALWIFSIGYDDIREFIDQSNQPPTPKMVQSNRYSYPATDSDYPGDIYARSDANTNSCAYGCSFTDERPYSNTYRYGYTYTSTHSPSR